MFHAYVSFMVIFLILLVRECRNCSSLKHTDEFVCSSSITSIKIMSSGILCKAVFQTGAIISGELIYQVTQHHIPEGRNCNTAMSTSNLSVTSMFEF